MPAFKTWEDNAAECRGVVIAWINQTDAPTLEAANSEGVCYAIVRDWISSCRGYASDRIAFIKTFMARDKDGKLLNAHVPEHYIKQQEKLMEGVKIYQEQARARKLKIKQLQEKGNEAAVKQLRLEGLQALQRAFGGVECEKLALYRSLDQVLVTAKKFETADAYLGLTFYWDANSESFGHVVGLELRYDKHRYGLIDPNLGLFSFPEFSDLISFLRDDVWPELYGPHGPNLFGLYIYNIGHGGTGLSPSEQKQLDDENAKQLESVQSSADKKGTKDPVI